LRVPPTICFTWPAWRSMHGRKEHISRGGNSIGEKDDNRLLENRIVDSGRNPFSRM
jgi:hypothetical protein